jgi:hypothetical protein
MGFTQPITEMSTRKRNSVVLVLERTIPTERPPLVGEVSANFLRIVSSRSRKIMFLGSRAYNLTAICEPIV